MPRIRSRVVETESVNQRMLRRGAVKRQHIDRWAVGHDQLAPGVIGPGHLQPTVIERIIERGAGAGVGQLLVVSATGQSFASGGAYVDADAILYQHGFDLVTEAGDSIVWPVDAVGEIQVEFRWDTFEGGGTIEIEVDGEVPAWGTIAEGTSGQEGCKRRGVHIAEGAHVKVKVTQASGSAEIGDVLIEFSIPDPTLSITPDSSYEALVLSDAPIAYWRLGETSGTAAADATGGGHTGTYTGTVTLGDSGVMQDGQGDPAVDASGTTGSGMEGADWADLEFAGLVPYTVECWFNADTLPASGSVILLQKQVTGSGAGWELIIVGGVTRYVRMSRGSGGGALVTGTAPIVVDTDYHVVTTFDGTTALMFVNGDHVGTSVDPAGAMGGNSVPLSIGYDSDSGGLAMFDGRIDEVAIYDRALSAVEIEQHYLVGTSG